MDGGLPRGLCPQPWGANAASVCKQLLHWGWKWPLWGLQQALPYGLGDLWGGISGDHLWPLGPTSLAYVPLCHAKMVIFPLFRSSDMGGPCWGLDLAFPSSSWGWAWSWGQRDWRSDKGSGGDLIPRAPSGLAAACGGSGVCLRDPRAAWGEGWSQGSAATGKNSLLWGLH